MDISTYSDSGQNPDYLDSDRRELCGLLARRILGLFEQEGLTIPEVDKVSGISVTDLILVASELPNKITLSRLLLVLGELLENLQPTPQEEPFCRSVNT